MKQIVFFVMCLSQASLANAIESYACVGTEPFWSMQVNNSGVVFQGDSGLMQFRKVVFQAPTNRPIEQTMNFRSAEGDGLHGFTEFTNYKCSDDMSDRLYPYLVHFTIGSQAFTGCCVTRSKPAKEERP